MFEGSWAAEENIMPENMIYKIVSEAYGNCNDYIARR